MNTRQAAKRDPRIAQRMAVSTRINGMEPNQLIVLLDQMGLSVQGTTIQLRDRLLRASIKTVEPDAPVTWNPDLDERPWDAIPATSAAIMREESFEEIPPVRRRGRKPKKMSKRSEEQSTEPESHDDIRRPATQTQEKANEQQTTNISIATVQTSSGTTTTITRTRPVCTTGTADNFAMQVVTANDQPRMQTGLPRQLLTMSSHTHLAYTPELMRILPTGYPWGVTGPVFQNAAKSTTPDSSTMTPALTQLPESMHSQRDTLGTSRPSVSPAVTSRITGDNEPRTEKHRSGQSNTTKKPGTYRVEQRATRENSQFEPTESQNSQQREQDESIQFVKEVNVNDNRTSQSEEEEDRSSSEAESADENNLQPMGPYGQLWRAYEEMSVVRPKSNGKSREQGHTQRPQDRPPREANHDHYEETPRLQGDFQERRERPRQHEVTEIRSPKNKKNKDTSDYEDKVIKRRQKQEKQKVSGNSDSNKEVDKRIKKREMYRESERRHRSLSTSSDSTSDSSSVTSESDSDHYRKLRRRRQHRSRDSSSSSSDSDYQEKKRKHHKKRSHANSERAGKNVKTLQSWNLKFNGEDKEPEEFLDRLQDCKNSLAMSDTELLNALPSIFTKTASRWYRSKRPDLFSWKDFKKSFRRQFLGRRDEEEIMEDLRKRTMAKGEKITNYISCLRYIIDHFKRPPPMKSLVKQAYKGLRKDYRHFMAGRRIKTLSELEKLGRIWEKEKELDEKFEEPPPKEKMSIPGAAYMGVSSIRKVGAVKHESSQESGDSDSSPAMRKQRGKRHRERNKKKKQTNSIAATNETLQGMSKGRPNPLRPSQNSATAAVAHSTPLNPLQPSFEPRWSWRPPRNNGQNPGRGGGQTQHWTGRGLYVGNRDQGTRYNQDRPIYGACYTCQSVGHRARECPHRMCYLCGAKGHYANECPSRRPAWQTYHNAPAEGNGRQGGQNSPLPPQQPTAGQAWRQ